MGGFRSSVRNAVIILTLGAGVERADAQWFRGGAYFGVGVGRTETGSLDERLGARGYPSFGPSAASVGIGGYATVDDRFMFGGEWTGIIKGSQEHQGRTVYLGGGYGTLGVGYAVRMSRRVRVYPRIGIGAGGLGLTFESTEDSVAFDDVLADPDAQADQTRGFQPSMTREHGLIDVGGGLEFLRSRSGRGTMIGIRAGYLIAPSNTHWEMNQRPVSGGPPATVGGPYLRVFIGAGAWR